jgi:hypothetical protein
MYCYGEPSNETVQRPAQPVRCNSLLGAVRGNWNESDIRTDAPQGRVETRLPGNHFAL